ncbi:probable G-protein coupled receptor Mth-like 3 [Anastrepha obliqua]|uniref:probable G-protein coupled receptor Mth-like 3 n=1 Tax=Anastrepha obliqua TaxID=95512 RepID=UPI0024096870|nr:probable G-protein coupled receptor Mth-like 3 [Anastrepha obliqua]
MLKSSKIQLIVVTLVVQLAQRFTAANILNCEFEDTVSLKNIRPQRDGSYVYEGVHIPKNLTAFYDYEERYDGTRHVVSPHMRGCVCKLKKCIKLCCKPDELLDVDSKTCIKFNKGQKEYFPQIVMFTDRYQNSGFIDVSKNFIHQLGIPCDTLEVLNPLLYTSSLTLLIDNGTLIRPSDGKFIPKSEYCLTPFWYNTTLSLNPVICYENEPISRLNHLKVLLLAISLPFLVTTIWVYLYIPKLHCLHNSCLVGYLSTFTLGSSILVSTLWVQYSPAACQAVGFLCYFSLMSAFFWLNISCFDLWRSVRGIRYQLQPSNPKMRFIYYSIHVWTAAFVFTIATIVVEFSSVDEAWKSGIGNGQCFIKTNSWSAVFYFYGPTGLLFLFNVIFFTLCAIDICQIKEAAHEFESEKSQQYKFATFLRLFIMMGVSWIMELLSYLFCKDVKILFTIFDLFNDSQGIILFILLVLRRRILVLLKERWNS